MKRIAFVTTCKGRAEHIKSTLPKNLADNDSYPNAVFVILDYSSPDDLLPYLFKNHQADMESGRLVVYSFLDPNPGPFRMAHAKNMAMRCGILEGADILVTLDADNFTGAATIGTGTFADFCEFYFRPFVPGERFFLCPDFTLIHSLPHGPGRPMRGYAGRLAIRAQDFIKAGGYNEIFDVWGSEDMDIIFRLQRMGYEKRHIPNGYLNTIPHPASVRFKEYPEAQRFENKRHVVDISERTDTVVNYGKIGCGDVRRHPSAKTITLSPLPTRIFGIGMQKTGTSSLHKAFQILGYDSFHWGAGEAPLIWQEMQQGRSKTLEQYYALSDNPLPLLYKELDKAYPGSKFILTVRDEQDWLRSVERMFDYRYNPTRWVWDTYPFTNRIHGILYGSPRPTREALLATYRAHNRDVRDYFKYRYEDFLVMDIPRGLSLELWVTLCGFLDKPFPRVSFPWSNDTKQTSFIAAAAAEYGEPSESQMNISRRRRHHRRNRHHHVNVITKWFRNMWRRWRSS